MNKNCKYVRKTLDLARKMIILADRGEMGCSEYSSTVLFGVVRDCAYKIKERAEQEKERLKSLGDWEQIQASDNVKSVRQTDETENGGR